VRRSGACVWWWLVEQVPRRHQWRRALCRHVSSRRRVCGLPAAHPITLWQICAVCSAGNAFKMIESCLSLELAWSLRLGAFGLWWAAARVENTPSTTARLAVLCRIQSPLTVTYCRLIVNIPAVTVYNKLHATNLLRQIKSLRRIYNILMCRDVAQQVERIVARQVHNKAK